MCARACSMGIVIASQSATIANFTVVIRMQCIITRYTQRKIGGYDSGTNGIYEWQWEKQLNFDLVRTFVSL